MIFIPNYSNMQYPCVVIQGDGVVRAYHEAPLNNRQVNYTDFYVNNDYAPRYGTQNFGNTTTLPTCFSNTELTDEVYYRVDFPNIVLTTVLLAYVLLYLPTKLVLSLFIRR